MLGDVVRGHRLGPVHCEADVAARLVEAVGAANAFEPARGIVLGVAECHRAGHRTARPEEPDHEQCEQQHHVEGEEKGVVEAGDDEADRRLQHDREAADEQAGHRFLHHGEIEEAVEQVRPARIAEERIARVDGADGDFRHDPREEAALEQGHDVDAQRAEHRDDEEEHEEQACERPQRRRQRGVGHAVDEQLHRYRRGERQ